MIKKIFLDDYKIADGPIPPAISWVYDDDVVKYAFDLAKAKSLLTEAGWTPGTDGSLTKDGKQFSFKITASRNPANEQVCAQLQQSWKALGITSTIELLEFGVFINQRRNTHNYDVILHGWLVPPDPDQFNYWHSSAIENGGLNVGEYRNPDVDRLLEQGRTTLDQQKRKEIYTQFQKIMADDLPELWLWYTGELDADSKKLLGLGPKSIYDVELHYANLWSLA